MTVTSEGGSELGRFLRARRETLRPEAVGLAAGERRRVRGLRRHELAILSGISTEYYVRLEQGRDKNPSMQVLQALGNALGLDEEAAAHLYRLSRPAPVPPLAARVPVAVAEPPPFLSGVIASWRTTPALVIDHLTTVLAANALARALSPYHALGTNRLRTVFLTPESWDVHHDWEVETENLAAALRSVTSGGTDDPGLADLVAELSERSERFRELWGRHHIRAPTGGVGRFDVPGVGPIELRYELLAVLSAPSPLPGRAGQFLLLFQPEPGSVSERRLAALAEMVDAG
jgi:transcriptional regulator with XRE-family HTH domain